MNGGQPLKRGTVRVLPAPVTLDADRNQGSLHPPRHVGRLRPGMKAEVQAEPPLSGRYQATVLVVDRVVDSASGTFGVRLELPNPKGEVPAGVKCRVSFAR